MARESHLRGTIKDKLVPLVRETYGFKIGTSQKEIVHNRNLYDTLKKDNGFVFKVSVNSPLVHITKYFSEFSRATGAL